MTHAKNAVNLRLFVGPHYELADRSVEGEQFGPKHNDEFDSCGTRRESFQHLNRRVPGSLVTGLVDSGFYHKNQHILCWKCGLIIDFWAETDDIFVKHSSRSPHCSLMKKERTKLFCKFYFGVINVVIKATKLFQNHRR